MNNETRLVQAVPTYLQRLGLGLAVLAAGCVALAGAVDIIGFKIFVDQDDSARAAAWVQAIGVPFAVLVTYLAASMQVKALREERRRDLGHQEAARLIHLQELTGWIATCVANTLKRRHNGNSNVESAVIRGIATENLLSLQRLDVTPFAIAKVSAQLIGAKATLMFVTDYYASAKGEFKAIRFQVVLRALTRLALAAEQRLDALAEQGLVESIAYEPAREWNLAGDWQTYFLEIGDPYPAYSPPDESGSLA